MATGQSRECCSCSSIFACYLQGEFLEQGQGFHRLFERKQSFSQVFCPDGVSWLFICCSAIIRTPGPLKGAQGGTDIVRFGTDISLSKLVRNVNPIHNTKYFILALTPGNRDWRSIADKRCVQKKTACSELWILLKKNSQHKRQT